MDGELVVRVLVVLEDLDNQLSEVMHDELEELLAVLLETTVEQVGNLILLVGVHVGPKEVNYEDFVYFCRLEGFNRELEILMDH